MATATDQGLYGKMALAEALGPRQGLGLHAKQAALVAVGVALLTVAAQIKVAVPPSPVAVNLGTFAVLTIGAAYGPRLGLTTILVYMAIGALGFDVFQSSTAGLAGLDYMMGTTGGYLVGYVLAVGAMGWLARRGWDRSVLWMALAMLIGNLVLYVPGLAWLGLLIEQGMFRPDAYATVWEQTLAWGLTPFLIGDAMKLALAALLLPAAWAVVGRART
ncbi:MAG: biotin transporter BioY [Paracoccaceae bacterium]|jgi:biotin transport system substrate-specific component|nr:biotin transporter BioY [Paracoccaceae bacterium]